MDNPYFESLQAKRRDVYRLVAAMPFEKQVHRPRPDGWSPLEVLEHLNLHDAWLLSNPSVRKGGPTGNRTLWIGRRLVSSGVTIPTAPFLVPKGGQTLIQLAQTSDEQHRRLADLVANADHGHTLIQIFPFGSFDAEGVCAVLDSHYEYHLKRL